VDYVFQNVVVAAKKIDKKIFNQYLVLNFYLIKLLILHILENKNFSKFLIINI